MLFVGLSDPAVLEEIEFILDTLEQHHLTVPKLLVGNKIDLPGAEDILNTLKELYGDRFRYLPVSATRGDNLSEFTHDLFVSLDVVRFYSKPPGKQADLTKPYVLKRGQTVIEAARLVHKDFAEKMKYTRLYHRNGEHSGLMVDRTHVVEDEDIFEFHA